MWSSQLKFKNKKLKENQPLLSVPGHTKQSLFILWSIVTIIIAQTFIYCKLVFFSYRHMFNMLYNMYNVIDAPCCEIIANKESTS